jgi:hypothetical protein
MGQTVMQFFFTTAWTASQGVLNGLLGPLQGMAYAILVVTLLMGVYESFLAGGSLRQLAATLVKFAIAAALIANWGTFIGDVVQAGTTLAGNFLNGNADMLMNWLNDLYTTITGSSLIALLTSGLSSLAMSLVMLAIIILSVVMFLSCMKILTICFVFWGGVLFCVGPFMVALAPSGVVSSHARSYFRSLAEWALWPVIYAMFVTLMNASGMGTVSAVLGQVNTGPPGTVFDQPTSNATTLALTSLLYGICLLIIPFIAHYVIGGSFVGVAAGVAAVVKTGVGMATGGGGRASAGGERAGGSGSVPIGGGSGGGTGVGGGLSSPASVSPSMPPPPSMPEVAVRRASAPPPVTVH